MGHSLFDEILFIITCGARRLRRNRNSPSAQPLLLDKDFHVLAVFFVDDVYDFPFYPRVKHLS